LRIGRNITDYAWDGKDEFGDLLANGVYFYRFVVSDGNKELEHRNQEKIDQYIKHGIGKMVIIR
jgi:hypothetical protein